MKSNINTNINTNAKHELFYYIFIIRSFTFIEKYLGKNKYYLIKKK